MRNVPELSQMAAKASACVADVFKKHTDKSEQLEKVCVEMEQKIGKLLTQKAALMEERMIMKMKNEEWDRKYNVLQTENGRLRQLITLKGPKTGVKNYIDLCSP